MREEVKGMIYPKDYIKLILILSLVFVVGTVLKFGVFSILNNDDTASNESISSENTESDISEGANSDSTESNTWNIYDAFKETTEDEVIKMLESNEVLGVANDENNIYIETTSGEHLRIKYNNSIIEYAKMRGIDVQEIFSTYSKAENKSSNMNRENALRFMAFIIMVVSIALILKGAYSRNMGKSLCAGDELRRISLSQSQDENTYQTTRTRKSDNQNIPNVHFSDVQGVDELKKDIFRIVDFLRNSSKYKEMGARTPKGIILYGPPGTGKTLLAKAIAGEASVPFFHANGSDFVEMYVGMGAKRVRELYQKARREAPSIVFIDEVDAIAHKRGQNNNSEDDKTINALLNELDGFNGDTNVVTICATNRIDMLDQAFQRAGRFDLKLAVDLPDRKARYAILKIHAKNKHFQNSNILQDLAKKTPGFSGAELESILNEAAILAASNNQDYITDYDIEEAFYKILLKGNKKKSDFSKETMEKIAWHESGHVLVTKLLTHDKVPSVTIIGSTSGAGGVTFRVPDETKLRTRQDLRNEISIKFGGRAAEELLVTNKDLVTTGASQDITEATTIIKAYICKYGMGNSGLIDHTQFTDRVSEEIESEAIELSNQVYSDTIKLLNDNYDTLRTLAGYLIENETLNEAEIDSIIETGAMPEQRENSAGIIDSENEYSEYSETKESNIEAKEIQLTPCHLTAYDLAVPVWAKAGCKIYGDKQIDDLYYRLKLREARKESHKGNEFICNW